MVTLLTIKQTTGVTHFKIMKNQSQSETNLLKSDLMDCILSDYRGKEEILLDVILNEYLFLVNDIRKDELRDIITNQFDSI